MSEGQAGLKRAAMGVIALSSQCIEPMHRAFKHAEASEHEKLGGRIVRVAGFIQVQQVHASLRAHKRKQTARAVCLLNSVSQVEQSSNAPLRQHSRLADSVIRKGPS